jgi:hypothetical protein
MRSSDVSMAALLILNMTTCYFGILARSHSRGMRSIVATRLSIRLTTSRRLKSVVNRDSISDRNTVGVVTILSSSRRAAWRTNFTLRHSPLPPVYSLLTSQPHRFAVEGALFLREWLDETGGVSYFNPRCRDARTQIVRPQVPKPSGV